MPSTVTTQRTCRSRTVTRYETVPVERVSAVTELGDPVYVYIVADGTGLVWWSRAHLTAHGPAMLEQVLQSLGRRCEVAWAPAPPRRLRHLRTTERWPRQFYAKDKEEAELWRTWRSENLNRFPPAWRKKLGLRGVVMRRLLQ